MNNTESSGVESLKIYYDRLFPYESMIKWLSYGAGTQLFERREFSFTLEEDKYIRYITFLSAEEMKKSFMQSLPRKIDIGAVFSVSPADKRNTPESNFFAEQREFVVDIDLTDYDDVRTCCQNTAICSKCWKFVVAAVEVLDMSLKTDFGFEHLLWVYSGRRGIHCWVSDERARLLSNEARSAIVSYYSIVESASTIAKLKLREPLHPFIDRAVKLLEPHFVNSILAQDGQHILKDQESWSVLLSAIPSDIVKAKVDSYLLQSSQEGVEVRWSRVKDIISSSNKKGGDMKQTTALRGAVSLIILMYMYPRIDANVSKQRNHLLKSPFAVHPKTGRVCVPVSPCSVASFSPSSVPTIRQLEEELTSGIPGDVNALSPYIKLFTGFLHKLQRANVNPTEGKYYYMSSFDII